MFYPGALCTHPCTDTSACAHIQSPTNPPTSTPILTATTSRTPCEHDRCNLYESNQLSRGFIIGRALFCPVCQIFNHAAKHAYHIERALRTRPRLRHSLAKLTYLPNQQSAITTTRLLLITLREHHAQDISSLLDNLRSQHAHLIKTRPLIGDPNTDNPQSPLTHALHFVARTLNIPSTQHSIANPRPTTTQQHQRYIRAATVCPCPILKVAAPGHPHMCEHCALLRQVITKSSTNDCPACASPHSDDGIPSTCAGCVIFALTH